MKSKIKKEIEKSGGRFLILPSFYMNLDISAPEVLLLSAILGLSEKDGYCWSSNENLSNTIGNRLSAKAVANSLTKFENMGLIKREFLDDKKRNRSKIFVLVDNISSNDVSSDNDRVSLYNDRVSSGDETPIHQAMKHVSSGDEQIIKYNKVDKKGNNKDNSKVYLASSKNEDVSKRALNLSTIPSGSSCSYISENNKTNSIPAKSSEVDIEFNKVFGRMIVKQ